MSAPNGDAVIFGVPLMARATAGNWSRVQHHFSATIGSLLRQSSSNFNIVVAGTDEPDVDLPFDTRYKFLRCENLSRGDRRSRQEDHQNRRVAIARRARDLGGGYLMFVDADDLVSSELVSFLESNPHPNGYLVAHGYVFNAVSGVIAPYPLPGYEEYPFDRICGTSAIVRLSAGELPDADGSPCLFERIFGKGHVQVRRLSFNENRPLAKLPFRAVAYVRETQEHVSQSDPNASGIRFYADLVRLLPAHALELTAELDREFNLRAAQVHLRAEQG